MNLHNNCDINILKNTDILSHIRSSSGDIDQYKQSDNIFTNNYALKNIRAFTMERRHSNAVRLTRLSQIAVILKAMREYTLGKSLINLVNVTKLSQILGNLKYLI